MDKKILYKKVVFIGFIIIILAIVAFFINGSNERNNAITLELDFGNGTKKVFYNPAVEEKRVWSLLQQTATISNIDLSAVNDFSIQKINGQVNGTDNKRWTLYVNGIKQESSPINIFVKSPDKVVFRFE